MRKPRKGRVMWCAWERDGGFLGATLEPSRGQSEIQCVRFGIPRSAVIRVRLTEVVPKRKGKK